MMETNEQHSVPLDNVVISIKDLNISFGDNHVLSDYNLDLMRGETIAVLGRSGSGKSVLIKCIIGLLKPDSGSINVLGKDVLSLSPKELALMRMKVGFLFQSNALYDSMTVRENLLFPLRRHRIKKTKGELDKLVHEALEDVELLNTENMLPIELSGGMKKRIALARTLMLRPEIVLYDEPTTGLDPITSRGISQLIVDVQKKYNTSSLVITHDLRCIHDVADRVAVLIDGKCYTVAPYDELSKSTDKKIMPFFE